MMKAFGHSVALRIFVGLLALAINLPVLAITLEEAFNSAVKIDPALRASKFNQDASNENIAIARSRLLPQVSLQGSSNQLTQTTTQDVPGSASLSRSFTGPSVNHQFVIRQGLLRPKDVSGLNFAELQAQYGEVKYQSDMSDLWTRVTYAWIDLVSSTQLVEVYERPLKPLLSAANQEKARLTQGDGTKDAAIEAEAQYQFAAATHQQALQNLRAKQRAFEILTQADSKSLLGVRLNLNPTPTFGESDRDRLWTRAKEKSFDLQFSELQVLLQRERVRMSRADHMPTLDVLASWNLAKNDATSTQGYRYQNKQVGIQYMVPIYAGGSISAADRQAALALEASIADSEAVANRVEGDFRVVWSSWLGQVARVQAGFKLVESSKEQLKATELSYVHGVKTIMELANAELAMSRRLADQINAVVEYQKYTARLSRNEFNLEN
jgi:protease secretion system outer membrane protein